MGSHSAKAHAGTSLRAKGHVPSTGAGEGLLGPMVSGSGLCSFPISLGPQHTQARAWLPAPALSQSWLPGPASFVLLLPSSPGVLEPRVVTAPPHWGRTGWTRQQGPRRIGGTGEAQPSPGAAGLPAELLPVAPRNTPGSPRQPHHTGRLSDTSPHHHLLVGLAGDLLSLADQKEGCVPVPAIPLRVPVPGGDGDTAVDAPALGLS